MSSIMIFPNKDLNPKFEELYRLNCQELVKQKGYDGNPEKISCENRNQALAKTVQDYSEWLVNAQNLNN